MDKIKATAGSTVAQVAAQNGIDEAALRAVNDIGDGTEGFSSETELIVPEPVDVSNANENFLSAALRERAWKRLKGQSQTLDGVLWGEAFGKGLKVAVAHEAWSSGGGKGADKKKSDESARGNEVEWVRTTGSLAYDSGELGGARDPTFNETSSLAFRTTTGLTVKGGVDYELDRAFVYRKGRKEPLRLAQEMARNNTVGLPLTSGLASKVEQGGRFRLVTNAALDASTKREITDGETDREAKLKLAASGKIESVFEWTEPNKVEVTVTTSHDVGVDADGSTSNRDKGTSASGNIKAKTQRTRQQVFKLDLTTEAGKKAYDALIQQRRGAAAKLAGTEGVAVEETDPAGLAKLDELSAEARFTGTRSDGEFKATTVSRRQGTTDTLRNELFAKLGLKSDPAAVGRSSSIGGNVARNREVRESDDGEFHREGDLTIEGEAGSRRAGSNLDISARRFKSFAFALPAVPSDKREKDVAPDGSEKDKKKQRWPDPIKAELPTTAALLLALPERASFEVYGTDKLTTGAGRTVDQTRTLDGVQSNKGTSTLTGKREREGVERVTVTRGEGNNVSIKAYFDRDYTGSLSASQSLNAANQTGLSGRTSGTVERKRGTTETLELRDLDLTEPDNKAAVEAALAGDPEPLRKVMLARAPQSSDDVSLVLDGDLNGNGSLNTTRGGETFGFDFKKGAKYELTLPRPKTAEEVARFMKPDAARERLPVTGAIAKEYPEGTKAMFSGEGAFGTGVGTSKAVPFDGGSSFEERSKTSASSSFNRTGSSTITATWEKDSVLSIDLRVDSTVTKKGDASAAATRRPGGLSTSLTGGSELVTTRSETGTIKLDMKKPEEEAAFTAMVRGDLGPLRDVLAARTGDDGKPLEYKKVWTKTDKVELAVKPTQDISASVRLRRINRDSDSWQVREREERKEVIEAAKAAGQRVRWIEEGGVLELSARPTIDLAGDALRAGSMATGLQRGAGVRATISFGGLIEYETLRPRLDGEPDDTPQPSAKAKAARAAAEAAAKAASGDGAATEGAGATEPGADGKPAVKAAATSTGLLGGVEDELRKRLADSPTARIPPFKAADASVLTKGFQFKVSGSRYSDIDIGATTGVSARTPGFWADASVTASPITRNTMTRLEIQGNAIDGDGVIELKLTESALDAKGPKAVAKFGLGVTTANLLGEGLTKRIGRLGADIVTSELDSIVSEAGVTDLVTKDITTTTSSASVSIKLDTKVVNGVPRNPEHAAAYEDLMRGDPTKALALQGKKTVDLADGAERDRGPKFQVFGKPIFEDRTVTTSGKTITKPEDGDFTTKFFSMLKAPFKVLTRDKEVSFNAVQASKTAVMASAPDLAQANHSAVYEFSLTDKDGLTSAAQMRALQQLAKTADLKPVGAQRLEPDEERGFLKKLLRSYAVHGRTETKVKGFVSKEGILAWQAKTPDEAIRAYGNFVVAGPDKLVGWMHPFKSVAARKLLEEYIGYVGNADQVASGDDTTAHYANYTANRYYQLTGHRITDDLPSWRTARAWGSLTETLNTSKNPEDWVKRFTDVLETRGVDVLGGFAAMRELLGRQHVKFSQFAANGRAVALNFEGEGEAPDPVSQVNKAPASATPVLEGKKAGDVVPSAASAVADAEVTP